MKENKICVEIAYALPEKQFLKKIDLEEGSIIYDAIIHSGVLDMFPEINLEKQSVGIFGKVKTLSDAVKAGDRIEIYRPLQIDPKEARRLKAKKAKLGQ